MDQKKIEGEILHKKERKNEVVIERESELKNKESILVMSKLPVPVVTKADFPPLNSMRRSKLLIVFSFFIKESQHRVSFPCNQKGPTRISHIFSNLIIIITM